MDYTKILCLGLTLITLPLAAQQAWVRQTDLTTGLTYDIPVGETGGGFEATMPVDTTKGGLFELFARGTAWDTKIYMLDSKIVRAYSPTVTVNLTTEDSYVRGGATTANYVRRTRADRPYKIVTNVSGLVAGSPSPAENSLYFCYKGCKYNAQTYSGMGQTASLLYESNLPNGTKTIGPVYHELGTSQLKNGCGEQTFTFVRYAADGIPDTILAQPTLEIWPVASASISNITAGMVYIDKLPTIAIQLNNLYPDSRTYTQIYPGAAVLGTGGTLVGGSECRFGAYYNPTQTQSSTNVPQNPTLTITDLSNYTPTDGLYTLEVWTATPFFNRVPERLYTVTFEVDRVISSRGLLNSSERATPAPAPVAVP